MRSPAAPALVPVPEVPDSYESRVSVLAGRTAKRLKCLFFGNFISSMSQYFSSQ